ncbi:deoxyuridine 5'-triphosphate nucleotidohydrolase [Candidatus Pacearchaeota archaeon]|nr:deoxyuridine 5'-triphosphate nucleotidohydrolase [Candidatus Pacearchaeota archaeon]
MLTKKEIQKEIERNNLVENFCDLKTQLQPNGFDLTVDKIFAFKSKGKIDFSNSERVLPECEEIKAEKEKEDDEYGWWKLKKGVYKVRTNEKVNLPNDLLGILFCRSSLLRVGSFTKHGLIDSGFSGFLEFILKVENDNGMDLKENARVSQVIFRKVKETEAYDGEYNDKENSDSK